MDLSRVKSGGVGDVNIIQLTAGRDTLKNHREINIILWGKCRVILRTAVFMLICTSVNSLSANLHI